jgi:tetratricopeptide (TPR) repeat protein
VQNRVGLHPEGGEKLVDIEFGILGRTALRIDGVLTEDWGTARINAVLATLLAHPGRDVPLHMLIEWAWPEDATTPAHPASTIHTYATRIRRWLERSAATPRLHLGNGICRLEVDKSLIDYGCFRSLILEARGHARAGDTERVSELAARALDLWRGPPLADLSSEPARAWRTRVLRHEWIPANALLISALIERGDFEEALARLHELEGEATSDITLAKLRLSALHGLARTSDAASFYLTTRRRLLDDGDEPAAEHLRQHQEALRILPEQRPPGSAAKPTPVPRRLRHDIAGFAGRRELLDALDAATATAESTGGVVIVDGIAGVGKTALVVHWAHLARDRFPDGDFFIDLNGFSDGMIVTQSQVVDEFLIALNHPPDHRMTERAKELLLSQLLAGRNCLVLLDNARDSAHLRGLVSLLPSCLIIVTSRRQLTALSRDTGARRVRVDPMTTTEAAELLLTRIGARRQVSETDRDQLVRLCGGLPLVLTVVADHVATRPAAHLSSFVERIDRRRLITDIGADADGPATPETFLAWSYVDLSEPERRLFRLLSAHPGTDFHAAAAWACDGRLPAETNRSLNNLVDAHLLEQPDHFDRFTFHDLIREFAQQRAELDEPAAERGAAARRLLNHYLSAATRAHHVLYPGTLTAPEAAADDTGEPRFADPGAAKAWFDRERVNLTAAIHLAAAQGHHDHTWQLADVVGTVLDRSGAYSTSCAVRELAVSAARASGHQLAEASALVGLGMVETKLGEHGQARAHLTAALSLVEDHGDLRGQISTLHHLARLELVHGDIAAAVHLYRRALGACQRIDDAEALCWTHLRIGETLRILEQHDQALVHLHQSQHYAQRIGDDSAEASCRTEIGLVYRDRGDPRAAAAHCEQALKLVEGMPIPDVAVMISCCVALAEIQHRAGDRSGAVGYVLRAITLAGRIRDVTAESQALEVYGDIQYANGELYGAGLAWQQAAILAERTANPNRAATLRDKADNATGPTQFPQARTGSPPRLQAPEAPAHRRNSSA